MLQFLIYKNGANSQFAFDLWWVLLNINHLAWCSKSARLLVRDRLGSNCVRKKSARVLLGSKVARNFSARSAVLIEDDRIEMLEQLKFLLVNNPRWYPNLNMNSNEHWLMSESLKDDKLPFGKCLSFEYLPAV